MPRTTAVFFCLLLNILFCAAGHAQNSFKDRDEALLYVAKTLKQATNLSYEGSAKLKHQYAMYVEDERLVYVTATQYDTTYLIVPYEAVEFADSINQPRTYLYLFTAFGAFTQYEKKSNKSYSTSRLEILMQDTSVFSPQRLMLAFDYLGKKGADSVQQKFNNPKFFGLRGYQQFPRYVLKDSMGKEMFVTDIIKKANKPALIFTWAEWCPPCVKLFDSLVQAGVNKDYSLILIKKGPKENLGGRYRIPKGFRWWEQAIFLFDIESVTDTLDNGSVPLVFWTDAGGTIIREHSGFDMPVAKFKQILDAIKQQKLKPGPRYYSFFDKPVITEAEARFKYVIERKGQLVTVLVYFRKFDKFVLKGTVIYKINTLGELSIVN